MKNQKLITISGAILLLFIAIYTSFHYGLSKRAINPAEANDICQRFYNEVENDIKTINSFGVINGNKVCRPVRNEVGSTNYDISIQFKVSQPNPISEEIVKKNINYLSASLPRKDYPVWVDNIPARSREPATLCVSSSRYIVENGKNFPQGPPKHYPRYTIPGSIKGFDPCNDL